MKLQADLVLMNNAMRSGRCFFIWLTDHRPFVLQQRGSMIRAHWFIQPPSNAVADIFLVYHICTMMGGMQTMRACTQCSTWPSAGAEVLGRSPSSWQGNPPGTPGFTGKQARVLLSGSPWHSVHWGIAARFTHISDFRYNICCKDNGY